MTKADLQTVIASLKQQAATGFSADHACGADSAIPCWMAHRHNEITPISAEQVISLNAMVSYAAYQSGQSEFRVERAFTDHFCIPNLKCLPTELYDLALRYMADQIPAAHC